MHRLDLSIQCENKAYKNTTYLHPNNEDEIRELLYGVEIAIRKMLKEAEGCT